MPTIEELMVRIAQLELVIVAQADRIAELERRLATSSQTSSRPPSSDPPWAKAPAPKRSSRTRSGRKPGKQPGAGSSSRRLVEAPDSAFEVSPTRCADCGESLDGAAEVDRVRRQVVDVAPPPPPKVTEYQVISPRCRCGHVSAPTATDEPRPVPNEQVDPAGTRAPQTETAQPDDDGAQFAATAPTPGGALIPAGVLGAGSPVRIGPGACAVAALLWNDGRATVRVRR